LGLKRIRYWVPSYIGMTYRVHVNHKLFGAQVLGVYRYRWLARFATWWHSLGVPDTTGYRSYYVEEIE